MQLKIGGKKVFFSSLGTGRQILILPGWWHDHTLWEKVQNKLSEKFQVLVLDFPGFGQSELNTNIKDLSGYAHFLNKVIRELNLKDFILLGHSFGGAVAIKTLALYPNTSVNKLILSDTAGIRPLRLKQIVGLILAKGGKLIFSLPVFQTFAHQARQILYGFLKEEDYLRAGPLKTTFSRIIKESVEGILDKINLPTIIVWGEKDDATPLSDAKIINQKIKDSKLVIIKNATHWPYLEQPEEFCRAVREFI